MAVRELSDAELIAGARKGDSDSYGELYRRHVDSARAAARALTRSRSDADDVTSEAFARVLRALQSGGGPDVSFRPYLVTAVRNVFYDKVRRNREEPTEDMSDEVNVALLDAANSQEDGTFAAAAFATLPERWQLVLWHTEVEGRSVSEVAPLLGLAPNAVAALAYRAREGLRQAYLQAHLRDQNTADCRECAANLGAYVRDGLSARDRRRVENHLDGCASCTALVAELADTNNTLRAALIPALIGVSSAAYLGGLGGHGLLGFFARLPKRQQFAAGGTAAAAAAVLALAAGAIGGTDSPAPAAKETVVVQSTDPVTTESVAPVTVPPPPPVTTVAPPSTVPVTAGPTMPPTPATPTTAKPPVTTTRPSTTLPPTTAVPVPPTLVVVAGQVSTALVGGEVQISVSVQNTGPSAATGIVLDVPAPAGATVGNTETLTAQRPLAQVVAYSGPGWGCSGNVSCTLAALPPGQTSVVVLTFELTAAAAPSFTLTPAITAPAGANVTITPITVPVGTVAGLVAAQTAQGRVVAIGNSVTTCTDLDLACADARNGIGAALNHNDFAMQYVNTAGGTFDSSTADLSLSGTVSRAYLLWGGDIVQGLTTAPNGAARGTVTFGTPAGSHTVTAAQVVDNSGDTYFAYADVTALVTGSGTYSVADVQTALDTGSFGGWSLVVIEHDPSLPERLLLVAMPMDVVSTSGGSGLSVDLVHPMVNATATLAVAGFEGERLLTGDSVSLSGFTVANVFDGEVPGPRNPAYDNTLGTDVLVTTASGLNGSQLTFDASTANDRFMLGLVAVALDL
jgi:RNA polymerase sigma factor (sigma-70 family)